jgi:arylsulfatase
LGIYQGGMSEHDAAMGRLLKLIDYLGIADNTIMVYSTDNGAEVMSWPDGGTTPFRGEKNTQYEGAYRVPALMRWPRVIKLWTLAFRADIFTGSSPGQCVRMAAVFQKISTAPETCIL